MVYTHGVRLCSDGSEQTHVLIYKEVLCTGIAIMFDLNLIYFEIQYCFKKLS